MSPVATDNDSNHLILMDKSIDAVLTDAGLKSSPSKMKNTLLEAGFTANQIENYGFNYSQISSLVSKMGNSVKCSKIKLTPKPSGTCTSKPRKKKIDGVSELESGTIRRVFNQEISSFYVQVLSIEAIPDSSVYQATISDGAEITNRCLIAARCVGRILKNKLVVIKATKFFINNNSIQITKYYIINKEQSVIGNPVSLDDGTCGMNITLTDDHEQLLEDFMQFSSLEDAKAANYISQDAPSSGLIEDKIVESDDGTGLYSRTEDSTGLYGGTQDSTGLYGGTQDSTGLYGGTQDSTGSFGGIEDSAVLYRRATREYYSNHHFDSLHKIRWDHCYTNSEYFMALDLESSHSVPNEDDVLLAPCTITAEPSFNHIEIGAECEL